MDDLQFNESLDALLAGESLTLPEPTDIRTTAPLFGDSSTTPATVSTQQQQQQHQQQLQQQADQDEKGMLDSYDFDPTSISYGNGTGASSAGEASLSYYQGQQQQQQPQQQQLYGTTTTTAGMPGTLMVAIPQQQQQQQQQIYPQIAQSSYNMTTATAAATVSTTVPSTAGGAAGVYVQGQLTTAMPPSRRSSIPIPSSSGASISSTNSSRAGSKDGSRSKKRKLPRRDSTMSRSSMTAVSEEDQDDRKRQDRNFREQQRSHKISQQIDQLREVLSEANVRFKPDKFSTLATVVDYIKQLQQRSAMLDEEHKKLITTISKTNEIVNERHLPQSARTSSLTTSSSSSMSVASSQTLEVSGAAPTTTTRTTPSSGVATIPSTNDLSAIGLPSTTVTAIGGPTPDNVMSTPPSAFGENVDHGGGGAIGEVPAAASATISSTGVGSGMALEPTDDMVFVQSLDYKIIFTKCCVPLAVASIDGRFLDCNPEFERLTGYSRKELLPTEYAGTANASEVVNSNGGGSGGVNPIPDHVPSSTVVKKRSAADAAAAAAAAAGGETKTPTTPIQNTPRNLSLFNILRRENMEEVFGVLSEMLKYAPTPSESEKSVVGGPNINGGKADGTKLSPVSRKDYWSGQVRLNRIAGLELRMDVSIVRTKDGKAKFFDVALSHVPNMSLG